MTQKLYVGNLSFQSTEDDIRNYFEENAGPTSEVKLIMDRETGRSRGFAFVTFENDEDAQKAVAELNDQEMDGRRLKINEAHERQPRGGGGGGGGYRGGGGGDRGGRGRY